MQICLLLISYLLPLADKQIHQYFNDSKTSDDNKFLSSYSITIYCHILVWLLLVAIRYYMRRVYYRRLRILGYYKHHSSVKRLSLIPSLVWHKATVVLLLLATLLSDSDKDLVISSKVVLKPINVLQIVITIAVSIVVPFLSKHLYVEIRFRSDRNPPDVFCVEDPQHLVTSAGLNEVGVRYGTHLHSSVHSGIARIVGIGLPLNFAELHTRFSKPIHSIVVPLRPSSYLEDLLEKQADLIYNLKLQNTHLRQMLYKVSQRSARESLQSS